MKRNDLVYLEPSMEASTPAMKRVAALTRICLLNPKLTKLQTGVSIDDYSTWRAVRFAEQDEIG